MRALSYYEQITDVGRDQRMTELAMQTMKELIARFPKSKYALSISLFLLFNASIITIIVIIRNIIYIKIE